MTSLLFDMPLIPPSVNHYAKHTRTGKHYRTAEASAFKAAIGIYARGAVESKNGFYVFITVTLGEGQRGDIDNFPKLVLDGLADAGVFRDKKGKRLSDGHVSELWVKVDRDTRPKTGSTFIGVTAIERL